MDEKTVAWDQGRYDECQKKLTPFLKVSLLNSDPSFDSTGRHRLHDHLELRLCSEEGCHFPTNLSTGWTEHQGQSKC